MGTAPTTRPQKDGRKCHEGIRWSSRRHNPYLDWRTIVAGSSVGSLTAFERSRSISVGNDVLGGATSSRSHALGGAVLAKGAIFRYELVSFHGPGGKGSLPSAAAL